MSSNYVGHLITSTIITLQHFATLHYTYRHFTSSHLHFTTLSFGLTHLHFLLFIAPHITNLDTVQFSHPSTYFQNNEPLHCPKEPLTTSLHFTSLFIFSFFHLYYQTFTSLYYSHSQLTSLHFLLFITFTLPHCFTLS